MIQQIIHKNSSSTRQQFNRDSLRRRLIPNTRGLLRLNKIGHIQPLLTFCLNTATFAYDGTYFQQGLGTAMASPVSAVVVSLVMEDVKQRDYVDDVISMLSVNEMEHLPWHLNSVEPSIQFTIERENKRCLPLLDLDVHKQNGPGKSRSKCSLLTHTSHQQFWSQDMIFRFFDEEA